MEEKIKVYVDSNEKGFITDCYLADNTKIICEFYHEESEIEYSNCKLLNLQEYDKQKDQRIVELEQELAEYKKYKEWQEQLDCKNADELIDFVMSNYLTEDEKCKTIKELNKQLAGLKEKAIVPRFRIGQEIWYVGYSSVQNWIINSIELKYIKDELCEIYRLGHDGTDDYNCCIMPVDSDRFFTTEQEAQAKLKEMKGNG